VARIKLLWQSKLVLLLVMPFTAALVVLQTHWWATRPGCGPVAIWTVGLSLLLGLVVLKLRTGTLGAAAGGAAIAASLMFSTVTFPYQPWQTALIPLLTLLLITSLATRMGRAQKEQLGTAEKRQGRAASQVAANLGVAAIVSSDFAQSWLIDTHWVSAAGLAPIPIFAPMLAALAEAAADTVSSEIGRVLGGRPRMITTLREIEPGTDGAISLAGTAAGVIAGGLVAVAGTIALRGGISLVWISWAGGVFGLFFDSLLGATLERRGWLNNDMVNFLSTASASAFALAMMAVLPHPGAG
jgi:uncharacterized protein (TIGR00297 family)